MGGPWIETGARPQWAALHDMGDFGKRQRRSGSRDVGRVPRGLFGERGLNREGQFAFARGIALVGKRLLDRLERGLSSVVRQRDLVVGGTDQQVTYAGQWLQESTDRRCVVIAIQGRD